jgi:hypothetical protein
MSRSKIMSRFFGATVAVALGVVGAAQSGHSRHPYVDGGQSADGRFVVTAELVGEPASGKQPATHAWEYTWKDLKTKQTHKGKLQGLRSGSNGVFDPVHAHLFVAPDGETFAVWNANVLAPTPMNAKPPKDLAASDVRDFPGFSHRLTIYKKTGEVVNRLDLKHFLNDADWNWLFCYGAQVYWQGNFSGLTRDNVPRVGYALYQVSPDYTVLETKIGATEEAARNAKARGVTPPADRLVRVDLISGKFLPADQQLPPEKTPVRPFKGGLSKRGGDGGMADYIPSLDPVRSEGSSKNSSGK